MYTIEEFDKGKTKILKYILYKKRSENEIRKKFSKEFDENAQNPVIDLMLEQKNVHGYGGTMRLGAYDCILKKGSKAQKAYGKEKISERHRHRYEVNNEYLQQIADAGLVFSGMSPDGMLAEVVELPNLDWFVACQFHPEFKSRPEHPHPLFKGLMDAVINKKKIKKSSQIFESFFYQG